MMISVFKRIALLLSASLAIGSLAAGGAEAQQPNIQQPNMERLRPAFPEMNFAERQLSGIAAVERLGARLPEVAGWYGKSASQLRDQLLTDRRMRVDSKGRLFVVEDMDAPLQGLTTGTAQTVMTGQLLPLNQTFTLHSRPGANRTIYIDFDGATITGTAWNSTNPKIIAKPYDIDGNPAAFSDAELQRIQYIWQRVAEDYAPFDVDVTTQVPASDRLIRATTTDQIYGTTVVVTNNAGVYSCQCGGIAYIGVFNSTSQKYKPAFVFYNMLANGDEKAVAEAISHEAGHNMGLSHDGIPGNAYYGGQGTDAVTGWAPIMGVGYYKPLVQFSKGEYTGANNKEDDFAVMQSYGLPLRADDYGNTPATAAIFPASGAAQDGVIERAGDVDLFSINAKAGAFTATVLPANRSADADLVLSLLDRAGTVIATSNPLNALNASLTAQLPAAGLYYIRVGATGQGDPATTGYSAYGSVGNYRVSATYTAAAGAAPTAILQASARTAAAPAAITFDAGSSADSDGTVKFYYWDFGDGTSDSTGSLRSATKTYTAPGVYTVRLTVVDDSGFSASAETTVTISSGTPAKALSVKSIALSLVSATGGTKAKAVVTVVNQLGNAVNAAAVTAVWSGVAPSSPMTKSTATGRVTFASPATTTRDCYTITVTGIALTGYSFTPDALPSKQICR